MKPRTTKALIAALLFCAGAINTHADSILLDGNFDSLAVGTAPDVGVPAGHWYFPADAVSTGSAETNASEFTIVVAPGGANVNSLHLSADTNVLGGQILPNIFTQSVNKGSGLFLIASFDLFVSSGHGGGAVYLGNGYVNTTNRGPQIGWDPIGNLYWGDTNGNVNIIASYPQGVWQSVRFEVDIDNDRYNLYSGQRGLPFSVIKSNLTYRSGTLPYFDRFAIARFSNYPDADAYFDNVVVGVAPHIVQQPGTVYLPGSGCGMLSVNATGTPVIGYQWYKNSGTVLVPGATNSSLTICVSSPSDTNFSTYRVLVTNAYGIAWSADGAVAFGSNLFSTNNSLITGRSGHTATLLPNGKILVVGGYGPGNIPLSSAELFDPITKTWTGTGPLTTARRFHSASLLANGKVLVAGGRNNIGFLSSSELYDPSSGTWTTNSSAMTILRAYHTATLLLNGKVLVVGGNNGSSLSSAELFDPASTNWTATGGMVNARTYHTTTLLPNGKVLSAGGYNSSGVPLSNSELYNPTSGTWTATTGSMSATRYTHTATLLLDGKVLVAGGYGSSIVSGTELYNPNTGTWAGTGSLTTARYVHTATLLPNGKVLVTAGSGSSGYLSSGELYDPVTAIWSATGTMNTARGYHTANLLPDGKVLVTGGQNSTNLALASTEQFDSGIAVVLTVTNQTSLSTGVFQLGFVGTPGMVFSGIGTTNLSLPMSNWAALGSVTEISPGQFQFTDSSATNYPQRFYRVRSP